MELISDMIVRGPTSHARIGWSAYARVEHSIHIVSLNEVDIDGVYVLIM
jgi:hypothetical protein